MECKTVFFTITIVILSLALIVFIVLYILEIGKYNNTQTKILSQNKTLKSLNERVRYLTEKSKSFKVEQQILPLNNNNNNNNLDKKIFVFGVADNISIICEPNYVADVKTLYSKVVDDVYNSDSTILDLTKYIPAFNMLNNKQIISLSSKTIVDNLKISIPYALPTDEIVKTRILYGEYVCKSILQN